MSLLPTKLTFGETSLAVVDRHGEPWLTARDLAKALGYQDESAVLRIYARNQEEFTDEMTCTVKLTVRWTISDVIPASSRREDVTYSRCFPEPARPRLSDAGCSTSSRRTSGETGQHAA